MILDGRDGAHGCQKCDDAAAHHLTRRLVITQMGGALAYRDPTRATHNLRMDPESAVAVLTANLDVSLVTSDRTFAAEMDVHSGSEVYRLLAAEDAPPWARLVAQGYDRWFTHGHPASKAADPLTVTAAVELGFTTFATQRVVIGSDARMQLDSNGIRLRMSESVDYPSFWAWTTMAVRHGLAAGMGYDPTLIARRRRNPDPLDR